MSPLILQTIVFIISALLAPTRLADAEAKPTTFGSLHKQY